MSISDERPPVWVGHVAVHSTDLAASTRFYLDIGMREIVANGDVTVLELRGGTHLVVLPGEPETEAGFDLMVDDLDATHAAWSETGLQPGEISRGRIHDSFTIDDPAGITITVNSTHAVGVV